MRLSVGSREIDLGDTIGAAEPETITFLIHAMIGRLGDEMFGFTTLHLHDTCGTGLANAAAALKLGVAQFDTTCAGLGGCPFAAHKGAAGNICTEEFVFMCEEMGISTGVDLEKLIECAQLAEDIVGHPLPGKVLRAGSLKRFRDAAVAA